MYSFQSLRCVHLFATPWTATCRLPCPSATPGVYWNSCPLSWWCHSTSHRLLSPSPPAFNLSQHQGLFKWVGSSHQVAKTLDFQFQHQSFQWIFRTDFLKDGLIGSPCSPRDSEESSPTPQFKNINSLVLSSVQFSCSVVSDSLQPHEPQHVRPPCPSPTPRVHPNPCPLSWWCHPTISSSVIPFSSCQQSFPESGSFQISQLFSSGDQSICVSASTQVLPMNTQDWSPLGWTGWISLQSKGLSRVFSNTTVQKHQFLGIQLSL